MIALLPERTSAMVGGFTLSFAACLVMPSWMQSPAELWHLNVSWLWSDLTWFSCLQTPAAAGFSLDVDLYGAWNDFVSEMWFFTYLSSSRLIVEQLVLRKSNVAALAARSRFRRLRFLRLFVCEEISGSTAVRLVTAARQSCFESLPTTFHFSSAFCSNFCRVPFPALAGSLLFFFTKVWLRCSTVLVSAARKNIRNTKLSQTDGYCYDNKSSQHTQVLPLQSR